MACTTILVGKAASYDGSTMIARNDDSGSGHFTAKKFTVIHPEELPKTYRSVLSHVEIPLPGDPMRMTATPNAVEGKGIWAAGDCVTGTKSVIAAIEQGREAGAQRLAALKESFSNMLEERSFGQKRLMNAFPHLKSSEHQAALEALREKYAQLRVGKKK